MIKPHTAAAKVGLYSCLFTSDIVLVSVHCSVIKTQWGVYLAHTSFSKGKCTLLTFDCFACKLFKMIYSKLPVKASLKNRLVGVFICSLVKWLLLQFYYWPFHAFFTITSSIGWIKCFNAAATVKKLQDNESIEPLPKRKLKPIQKARMMRSLCTNIIVNAIQCKDKSYMNTNLEGSVQVQHAECVMSATSSW